MNREAIERLAIDSAAGELSEDALRLFKSYLAQHPEANEWATDMTAIYEMTQAAIDVKIEDAAPPMVEKKPSSPVNWFAAGRWAAVIAIAISAGFSIGRWSQPAKTRVEIFRIPEQPRTTAKVADLKAKYAGTFWGQKVLASTEPKPRPRAAAHTPTGNFWDIYRQHLKEKRYE